MALIRWPVFAAAAALVVAWVGFGVLRSPDGPQAPPPLNRNIVTSFWSVSVAGGAPRLVLRTRGWQDEWAAYRTDGSISFRRWTTFRTVALFATTRDGSVRKVGNLPSPQRPAVWSADGKTRAFAPPVRSRANGYRPELVVVDEGRKRVFRLDAGAASPVALAPHGDRLLFSWGRQLFLLDTKSGRRTLFANEGTFAAAWSPKDRIIAYVDREGLVVRSVETGRRKVLVPGVRGSVGSFSPDGRTILYVTQKVTQSAQTPS